MTLWTKLIVAGLLLAVLGGLAMLYGNAREETGRLEERTAQLSAQAEWRKNFDRDRAASALRVSKAEANLRDERRRSDAKIAEILQRDQAAKDWFNTRVPTAWVDFIWLHDSGPVSVVPGGPEPTARIDVTNTPTIRTH